MTTYGVWEYISAEEITSPVACRDDAAGPGVASGCRVWCVIPFAVGGVAGWLRTCDVLEMGGSVPLGWHVPATGRCEIAWDGEPVEGVDAESVLASAPPNPELRRLYEDLAAGVVDVADRRGAGGRTDVIVLTGGGYELRRREDGMDMMVRRLTGAEAAALAEEWGDAEAAERIRGLGV